MDTAAKPTRENRTITIDFQNETTYVQLLGDGKAFVELGVYATFVQKLSLTYYTHNLRQQARRGSLAYAIDLHRYFVEKAP